VTFLPVAHRELRVACRKRGTFVTRVVTALIGLVIGGFCLLLSSLANGPMAGIGKALFVILTWISLAAALGAGLFVTSDCLSEEKREGTLGLLFLTDLRGYDVVAGKFLATSLRAFYGMFALFPVLGVTLLMGGVSGIEFWKTALALINALFFSLAVGLFVSATGRDWHRVMWQTLLWLALFCFILPATDWLVSEATHGNVLLHVRLASPFTVFRRASGYPLPEYWNALLVTQGIAWSLLAIACGIVPRSWQERGRKNSGSTKSLRYAWTYGSSEQRTRLRRKLLEINPVLWLSSRERRQSWGAWFMALLLAVLFPLPALLDWPASSWGVWTFVAGCLILVLYLWVASQASRFFVQARRSGLIELLVIGPLTTRQIIHGQWRSLLKIFAAPVILIVLISVLASILSMEFWSGGRPFSFRGEQVLITGISSVAGGLAVLCNMAALAWFGMWMGLTSKSVNFATFKTVIFVQVIPWFGIMFACGIFTATTAFMASSSTSWANWWPHMTKVLSSGLSIVKDFGFIIWTSQRLFSSFRERASRNWAQPIQSAPVRARALPPPLPTISTPMSR
jgi:hypothetical protein